MQIAALRRRRQLRLLRQRFAHAQHSAGRQPRLLDTAPQNMMMAAAKLMTSMVLLVRHTTPRLLVCELPLGPQYLLHYCEYYCYDYDYDYYDI